MKEATAVIFRQKSVACLKEVREGGMAKKPKGQEGWEVILVSFRRLK